MIDTSIAVRGCGDDKVFTVTVDLHGGVYIGEGSTLLLAVCSLEDQLQMIIPAVKLALRELGVEL